MRKKRPQRNNCGNELHITMRYKNGTFGNAEHMHCCYDCGYKSSWEDGRGYPKEEEIVVPEDEAVTV